MPEGARLDNDAPESPRSPDNVGQFPCIAATVVASLHHCDDCNENEGDAVAKRARLKREPSGPEMFASHADTQVIYCGDNLDKLRSMPSGLVDLIYIDPPFNSNRNYEVFWGETKEKRAFSKRTGKAIVVLTVKEITEEEIAMRLV
jgi:16S rRNA G966 N2-methylase RsmD